MPKNKMIGLNREQEILAAIEKHPFIRIIDLAKNLEMWDSNLRKIIKRLVKEGKVETVAKKGYLCVKLKDK